MFTWPDVNDLEVREILLEFRNFLFEHNFQIYYNQASLDGLFIVPYPTRALHDSFQIYEKLFFLSRPVSSLESEFFFGKLSTKLLETGFFRYDEKNNISSNFRLISLNHVLIAIPYSHLPIQRVYIGADSLSLARNVTLSAINVKRDILDLFTGTGIQLLLLKDKLRSGIGIDAVQDAVKCAKLNGALNGLTDDKYAIYCKNLEEYSLENLGDYDLILANPPIVPTPAFLSRKNRIYLDGGEDGLHFIRKIVPQCTSTLLRDEGIANILVCSLGDQNGPFFLNEVEELVDRNKGYKTIIIKKLPVELDAFYRSKNKTALYDSWMDFYDSYQATHWYRLFLQIGKREKFRNETFNLTRTVFELNDKYATPSSFERFFYVKNGQSYEDVIRYVLERFGEPAATLKNVSREVQHRFPEKFSHRGDSFRFCSLIMQKKRISPQLERFTW
ncbi:MAG: hypothetical protein ACFFD4_32570 [Candidatus Odinarchaeota archaeon]